MIGFRRISTALLAVSLMVFALACGDDDISDGQGQSGDNQSASSEDDCSEDETWDPVAEQCVDDENDPNENDPDPSENDPDPNENDPDPNENDPNENDPNENDPNENDPNENDPNENDPDPPPNGDECGPGDLIGQACGTGGNTLPGAEVTLSGQGCDGENVNETVTADQNGIYEFEDIPAGDYHLQIQSGQFTGSDSVTIYAGVEKDLLDDAKKVCLAGDQTDVAVLEGTYDDVGSLLDGLQIEYDVVGGDMGGGMPFLFGDGDAGEFLSDPNEMNQYQILFIECGGLWNELQTGGFDDFTDGSDVEMDEVKANLRHFVESGNSLYVSDQSQPFIQKAIPEAVDFYQENQGESGPRQGTAQTVTAEVASNQMQTLLNSNHTEIEFDLGGWSVAEGGPSESTTHFQGDVELNEGSLDEAPLMISYDYPQGGNIIFTSFHNSEQASGEMMEILEFMIFQL